MKKIFRTLLLGLLLGGLLPVMAQSAKVVRSDFDNATYTFTFDDVSREQQTVENQVFDVVTLAGSAPSEHLGKPALPIVTKFIEIPICASVSVEISNVQLVTLRPLKHRMLPVQPSPCKSDIGPRPLVIDEAVYAEDAFYQQPEAWVEVMGVARDRNIAMLRLSPVSYNPVTGEMQMVKQMTVRLSFRDADAAATTAMRERYYSPDFALGSEMLSSLPVRKEIHKTAPLHYLIVAHSQFRGQLDEFVAWKKRQGFIVTVAYTDDAAVGTSNTSIAAYTKSFYTNATAELPAPTYLLLVGDHQQIPAFSARCSTPATDHVTDLYYVSWTDGDNLPDCYLGRFSARNANELTPQIEKTIYYERYDFTPSNSDYLGKGILIAGEDRGYASDNAYTYADPAMDYIAKTYVNAENGFSDVRYYKNNTSFAPAGVTVTGCGQNASSATALRNLYSQGYGWINYSAHGYDNEWSTPEFTTSHVNSMNNANRPSVMIGNCCLSGKFNTTAYDACLGEALLRKGGKAGAVAYIGGTNSTYWPQDFCWAVGVRSNFSNQMNTNYDSHNLGCYDRLFHTHNELYTYWHNTMGAVIYAGNTAAQSYSNSYALYYWEIYELFGDPSLMPWLGKPQTMTVDAGDVIPLGTTDYIVTAVPRAYVALTTAEEHDFVCAAYADRNSGEAVLHLPSDLAPGEYELAVWAQNYKPVFKPVNVTVLDGAFLQIREVSCTTGRLVPGAYNDFDVVVGNLGNRASQGGTISVTLDDHAVGCLTPVFSVGAIAADATATIPGAVRIYVPADMADGDIVRMSMSLDFDGGHSGKNAAFAVSAPRIEFTEIHVSPALTSGAQSAISVRISNTGSNSTAALTTRLRHNYGLVAQAPEDIALGIMDPGFARTVTFYVTMADSLPVGDVPFDIMLLADDADPVVHTIAFRAGQSDFDGFESNNFETLPWTNSNNPWIITSQQKHSGAYCARSKNNLNNSSSSQLSITWTSIANDSISFWYKVSSEDSYDKFTFSIDNHSRLTASGETDWTRAAYAVSAGTHTFVFKYAKDMSQSSGEDCAYIDDIRFPVVVHGATFLSDTVCQGQPYSFDGFEVSTAEAGTFHFAAASGDTLLALTVAEAPQVTVESSGNFAEGGAVILVAHGASRYEWSNGATGSVLIDYPTGSTTYTVTGYNGNCSDQASVTVGVGINETDGRTPVLIYPNPAQHWTVVTAEGMHSVSLVNQLGQELMRQKADGPQARLNIQNIPNGVYFVKVEFANSVSVTKLIKK